MVNFASLKKSSADIGRLTKEIEKINAPQGGNTERKEDDRFWKLTRGKDGNGSAVIRFLPAPQADGDDALPWVRYFDHGFKGPTGKWYIENSLTTFNQKDPVSELNRELWGDGAIKEESYRPIERKQAREQKRRLHYIANIYVVSDPANRENEGKVFLFKFGAKIFDKLNLLMSPEYEGDKPVNPFHLWEGANFKLRVRTVAGYPNYEQSVFEAPGPLSDDDAVLEKAYNSEFSLKEFIDPKNYKSYDELKKRLEEVMGGSGVVAATAPTFEGPKARKTKEASVEEDIPFDVAGEEDPDMKAFMSLADE